MWLLVVLIFGINATRLIYEAIFRVIYEAPEVVQWFYSAYLQITLALKLEVVGLSFYDFWIQRVKIYL